MKFSALIQPLASSIQRLVLVFILLTTGYLILTTSAHAQTSTTTTVGSMQTPTQDSKYAPKFNSDVPLDQHSYIQASMIEVMSAMICQLSGKDPIRKDHKCLGVDPQTGNIGFVENGGGAIGAVGLFISYTFTPPASSADYARYLAGNFGVAKKTYAQSPCVNNPAQGFGFCGIAPLLDIWVAMRNIAYLLFVIIFVIIGLAIMLRVHIDPRTVMTIENQIPKIIVGILLVTFSFAISGLLIDVMYVAIYLVGGVLINADKTHPIGVGLGEIATSPTPFDIINRLWPGGNGSLDGGGFGELSAQGSNTVRELILNVLGGQGVGADRPALDYGVVDLIGGGFTAAVGLIVGILAALLIFIALIYTAIRLWIILVVAYISILLDIVFAPFWFLIGLFPGSNAGIGGWVKDMLANLAVFPTAISMFILAKVFSEIARDTTAGAMFVPPLAGGGELSGDIFAGIIALGFLFMTPHVLQITRGAIKAPNINYGPVFDPVGQAGGTVKSFASSAAEYRMKTPMPGDRGGAKSLFKRLVG